MHGLIFRYDDPFWATFYPPNGFNCRCSVKALGEREMKREGLSLSKGQERLVETHRVLNRKGETEATIGLKMPTGETLMTDKGFDYNVGRMSYRPNLDLYPEALAHQFAKAEMGGEAFKLDYKRFEREVTPYVEPLRNLTKDKKNYDALLQKARNQLSKEYKFAAGLLTKQAKGVVVTETSTVWLSDDTLLKQLINHLDLKADDYAKLPDILHSPDKVVEDKNHHFKLFKEINGRKFVAVIKVLESVNEIFLQSWHLATDKQWNKAFNR